MNGANMDTRKPKLEHWVFESELSAARQHAGLVERLSEILGDIRMGVRPRDALERLIESILGIAEENLWTMLRTIHDGKSRTFGVAASTLNCALLCAILFERYEDRLGSLYLMVRSAVLHDIGMVYLPEAILNKVGKLDERERALLEAHPAMGYERLKEWGEPEEVQLAALQHHEEWKGGGYPAGLREQEIHPYARLLGPVLTLNALLSERPYRGSLIGYWAMKQILAQADKRFSPAAVKALVNVFGLYPPGSLVLLTDGSIGRVLETTFAQPLRPKVQILIDSAGRVYPNETGPVLNLGNAKKLFIARSVSAGDLRDQG